MTYAMPSFTQFWNLVKGRLTVDAMLLTLLYGPKHVYKEGEDYSQPEGPEGKPWCRLVIAPTMSLWPQADAPGMLKPVAFIVRAECNNFLDPNYDKQAALEGLHAQVKMLLDGWAPDPASMGTTKIAFPVFLQRIIEPRLMWDDQRKLNFMTAEYRCEVITS
jgi:hypothetical protein